MKLSTLKSALFTLCLATSFGCKVNSGSSTKTAAAAAVPEKAQEPLKPFIAAMPAPQEIADDIDVAAKWADCLGSNGKANDLFARDNFHKTWAQLSASWENVLAKTGDANVAYETWQAYAMETVQTARNEGVQLDTLGDDKLKTSDHNEIRRCRTLGIVSAIETFTLILRTRVPNHCDAKLMSRDGALQANFVCTKVMNTDNKTVFAHRDFSAGKCEAASSEACGTNFDTKLKTLSELCEGVNDASTSAMRDAARKSMCL